MYNKNSSWGEEGVVDGGSSERCLSEVVGSLKNLS